MLCFRAIAKFSLAEVDHAGTCMNLVLGKGKVNIDYANGRLALAKFLISICLWKVSLLYVIALCAPCCKRLSEVAMK